VGLSAGDERERQQQLADSVALEAKDDCYSRRAPSSSGSNAGSPENATSPEQAKTEAL
jgi:hypothetical protein